MNNDVEQLALWEELPTLEFRAARVRRIPITKPQFAPFAPADARYAELVLASGSPSKAEVLARLGLIFKIDPADIDEKSVVASDPEELVAELALAKGTVVSQRHIQALVVSADTVVEGPSGIIGKPRDKEDALRILCELNGRTHRVVTGLAVIDATAGRTARCVVVTTVRLRSQSTEAIGRYVRTGEPLGKAGAYALQGIGALLVQEVIGEYTNVLGLPVSAFVNLLCELGYELV